MRLFDELQRTPTTRIEWLADLRKRALGATVLDASTTQRVVDAWIRGQSDCFEQGYKVLESGLPITPITLPLWVEARGRECSWAALLEQGPSVEGPKLEVDVRMLCLPFPRVDSKDFLPNPSQLPYARSLYSADQLQKMDDYEKLLGEYLDAQNTVFRIQVGADGAMVGFQPDQWSDGVGDVQQAAFVDLFFVLALLHCRNVTLVEKCAPRHERRQAERSGGPPPTRYHVLEIDSVLRRAMNEVTGAEPTHGLVALHMVRGHFKTYSAERPMLGRMVGTWWWDHHVRGNPDRGIIDKDYALV